jgi:hypothetical protein
MREALVDFDLNRAHISRRLRRQFQSAQPFQSNLSAEPFMDLAPKYVGRKEYLMKMPAIFKGESLTRLAQGAAVGAVATIIIGFNWGAETNATMPVNAAFPPGSTSPNPAFADACAAALSKIIWIQTPAAKRPCSPVRISCQFGDH